MDARAHRGTGKSDPLDAHRIAAAVLSLEPRQLRRPRSDDGIRAALQILATAREYMTTERTATINALTALLRVADLGIDARKPLTARQVSEVARWRTRVEDLATATARGEAVRLAKRVTDLDSELTANQSRLTELIRDSKAAVLLDKIGIGRSPSQSSMRRGRTPDGFVPKRPSPRWRASARSRPHQGTPLVIGSTAAVTGGSTAPCPWPSSPA